jgi:hypothetical protein
MVMTAYNRVAATLLAVGAALTGSASTPLPAAVRGPEPLPVVAGEAPLFQTSDRCLACHKGLTTSAGVDVSIGYDWRASMMANSARDPYWQAAVRRESIDHPQASALIQNTCSRCHMPMANVTARMAGGMGEVFANLPVGGSDAADAPLAADGVSCAVCHQITPEGLGEEASFEGGFAIAAEAPAEGRTIYGPFEPDEGGASIMRSATGYDPTEGTHIQSSDLCGSCHTLLTHAIRADVSQGPEFPEQVPYLEWEASSYAVDERSCQECHMPLVGEDVPVTAVLGRARPEVSRHVFRGGNFFMLRMLNRYRAELGVVALPQELALAADRTEEHLGTSTASVSVLDARREGDRVVADVDVRNLAGHKFPTAYPSRRAWLHVTVTDAAGRTVFESGAFSRDGSVVGNDNDQDPARFEPHYAEITRADQVQIYEAVMADAAGRPTTGLLSADHWLKENRLLPNGYDAGRADSRIAVRGRATSDADFGPGGDRVRYSVSVGAAQGPLTMRAELWFQPIAFRWAENLSGYDSFETQRFVRYYRDMASASATLVASRSVRVQ